MKKMIKKIMKGVALGAFILTTGNSIAKMNDDPEFIYVYDNNGDITTDPPACAGTSGRCAWIHLYDPNTTDHVGAQVLDDNGNPEFVPGSRL